LRGVELPINVIIIIVICLIVLLAIVALFFGVWNPGKGTLTLEAAKNNACQMLVSMGCNQYPESISISDFDADKSDSGGCSFGGSSVSGDNLDSLCKCWYNLNSESCKTTLCGCGTSNLPPSPPGS
jgi:hypothetical protein